MDSLETESSAIDDKNNEFEFMAPYTDAMEASCILVQRLTRNLMRYRQEILNSPNPDSLHDFRITIRKIRSLLAQLDDVLPEPGLSYQRAAFKSVMDKTSLLRDMEVCHWMIKEQGKKSFQIKENLIFIQDHIQSCENLEREKLVKYLMSDVFNTLLNQWDTYLVSVNNVNHELEKSRTPIRLVASEAIGLCYLKTAKQISKVLDNKSGIERIHKLRKSGKKLRYLIELFSDLYPAKAVNRTIKDLKKFQDCLGNMQDCEVQVNIFHELSNSMNENLTKENRRAIKQLIKKRKNQKNKYHKKSIMLISEYSENSDKALARLVQL